MSAPTQVSPEVIPAQQPAPEGDPFRFGWRYVWQKDERGLMAQVQVPLKYEDVLHPQEEDFIVNNPAHAKDAHYLENALLIALNGREGMEVLRDVRVDWGSETVKPHCPDLAVFAEVRKPWKRDAGTFQVREVGAQPVLVIEVTSPSTRSYDLDDKVVEYFKAGVPFYAIVDYRPELELRQVYVLGYHATSRGYVRVGLNEKGWLWLESVRLWLASERDQVVCFDEQHVRIPHVQELNRFAHKVETRVKEAERDAQEARKQADEARKKADDLATRMAEMEAELERLRSTP